MRYIVTKNNKTLALSLMLVGILAVAFGFITDAHRAWASLLLGNYYVMVAALAGTFFLAVQYVAEVGWSVQIKRVLMAFGTYLWIPGVVMLIIFFFGGHHLYHWTHHELFEKFLEDGKTLNPEYDEVIAGKAGYLNSPFFVIRILLYFTIWYGMSMYFRNQSKMEDLDGNIARHKKLVRYSAAFLVLFAITSSTSSWDIIMSIDTHWYSTLFGWYCFSGLFVTGLATIILTTIYLKKNGYLENVNENHLHDLGTFLLAISALWTYLWFCQFMLIWYANIPEEITYFMQRFAHFKVLFTINVFINFFIPFFVLVKRDAKRKMGILMFVSIVLLVGHWIDFYLMIMPGAVGEHASIGFTEIGITLGFIGAFIFMITKALAEIPLVPQKHPMLGESIHHHI